MTGDTGSVVAESKLASTARAGRGACLTWSTVRTGLVIMPGELLRSAIEIICLTGAVCGRRTEMCLMSRAGIAQVPSVISPPTLICVPDGRPFRMTTDRAAVS